MKVDFIEIGSCDRNTLWGDPVRQEQSGIVVEPIKIYLDLVPKQFIHVCAAVSDHKGEESIYWVHPNDADRLGKDWLKACSSIGAPTPAVKKFIGEGNMDLIRESPVRVTTFASIVNEHGVTGCGFLKIDAEGEDCRIVTRMIEDFQAGRIGFLPDRLEYEANSLSTGENKVRTRKLVIGSGYRFVGRVGTGWHRSLVFEREANEGVSGIQHEDGQVSP